MIDDISAYIFARTTYEFLLSQFNALAFGWLGRTLLWVHGIGSTLLALHLMWHGYQLITGRTSSSATAPLTDSVRAVVILSLALGTTVGGNTLFQWLGEDLVRAVAAVVHDGDGDVLGEIDRNFGYMQLALSSIDWIQAPTTDIQAAKARNMGLVTLGIGGPGLMGMAMLLTLQIALSLFVGLGPLFVLCLIWRRTRPLFDGWLLHGLGTMFAMATLVVMLEIALPMVGAVAAAFWTATWTGANPEGVTSLAMQQGGLGLILTTMIISAPWIAARFFKATLGDFLPFSAFMNQMDDRQAAQAYASSSHAYAPERDHAPTPTHAHRVSASAQAQTDEIKQATDTRTFSERYPNAVVSLDGHGGEGDPLPASLRALAMTQPTPIRTFSSADVRVTGTSEAFSSSSVEQMQKVMAQDCNVVEHMLRRSGNVELVEKFKVLKIELSLDDWRVKYAGTQNADAYAQAHFVGARVEFQADRVKAAGTMHYRVNQIVHELRHLTTENNDMKSASSGTPGSSIEHDAREFAEDFMNKYWKPEYEFYKK